MLDGQLAEAKEQLWEPVESGKVIRALLQWIYTASVEDGEDVENLEAVFTAADKYDMQPLSKECHRLLIKLLKPDTVFRLLCFGDFYGLEVLKDHAMKLVVSEKMEVDPRSASQWEHARSRDQKEKLLGELFNMAIKILK